MTSEFQEFNLEDVADLNGGYAFKSEEYTEAGHFVLRTVNITDDGRITKNGATYVSNDSAKKYERFQLKEFDTLFVMVGATLGKTGLVRLNDLPALLNQNMWVIRANNSIVDPLYLHYAFKVLSKPLSSLASGSARGFVKRDDFRRMKIRLPKLSNQIKISSLLGAIDDRITLLRETNTTLEAIAQALFKSWFVDFDAVSAKSLGKLPEGMDEATAALFPDMFEESELGVIPKEWQVKTMSEVLKPKNDRVCDLEVPEYSSTNTGLVPREKMYTKQLSSSSSKNKLIKRGDIVFGLSRQLLNFGQMKDASGSVSSAYKVYEVDSTSVLPALIGRLIRTRADYFFNAVSASSREGQSISSEALGVLKYCQPPMDVQQTLWKNIDVLVEAGDHKLLQAEQLELIRDALLPPLISGQLRIADAEAKLEKATA